MYDNVQGLTEDIPDSPYVASWGSHLHEFRPVPFTGPRFAVIRPHGGEDSFGEERRVDVFDRSMIDHDGLTRVEHAYGYTTPMLCINTFTLIDALSAPFGAA